MLESQLEPRHLGAVLNRLYPDTDTRWMSPALRAVLVRRWVRQLCTWLEAVGVTPQEVADALAGINRKE